LKKKVQETTRITTKKQIKVGEGEECKVAHD